MHPTQWAGLRPQHPAIVMAETGETLSYAGLDAMSNRGAHLFRKLGMMPGDVIAIWAENRLDYLPICWAAERAGLFFVPVSSRLKASEADYILRDSGARVLIMSTGIGVEAKDFAENFAPDRSALKVLLLGDRLGGLGNWHEAAASLPVAPIADEAPGRPMLYSSGTTGRPKGINHGRRDGTILDDHPYEGWLRESYGFGEDTVFLSPAPLYHAAPLLFTLTVNRMGGTIVVMERFDADKCLRMIEDHRVTHTQMVPTMFVRMLHLPENVRNGYELSSLQTIIHAGSPCPVAVKQAMLDWMGPIIHEYYGASEGFGRTCIGPDEWLARPGSVGKATQGILHLCGEDGAEVGVGETGLVYFESDVEFRYHGDPEKTAAACHPDHPDWRTLGDIGHVDGQGYLTLTDRRAFTVISGGVNIYPQEAENVLSGHPQIADVAVFGVPDPEMGEAVIAVAELIGGAQASDAAEDEMIGWCRARLAHYKCPRQILFEESLPREPTGKLLKKALRERYRDLRMPESTPSPSREDQK